MDKLKDLINTCGYSVLISRRDDKVYVEAETQISDNEFLSFEFEGVTIESTIETAWLELLGGADDND